MLRFCWKKSFSLFLKFDQVQLESGRRVDTEDDHQLQDGCRQPGDNVIHLFFVSDSVDNVCPLTI